MNKFNSIKHIDLKELVTHGWKSLLICFCSTIFLIFLGFLAPNLLEVIHISPDKTKDIAGNLLSAYVGVLSVSLAISAIILSILQIASRKINIIELVFKNSFFSPTFYFGLINIGVLSFIGLFLPQEQIFHSEFILTRIVVTELYLFIIFVGLVIIVFSKVFKYLDFSLITKEYISNALKLARLEKVKALSNEKLQKISQVGKEINWEISDGIIKEDEILINNYLDALFEIFKINSNSNVVINLPYHFRKWYIEANDKKANSITYRFLQFWRLIFGYLSTDLKNSAASTFIGFSASLYDQIYKQNPLTETGNYFTIRLKEMIQAKLFKIQNKNDKNELDRVMSEIDILLSDFNILLKTAAQNYDSKTLKYSLNELDLTLSMSLIEESDILEESQDQEIAEVSTKNPEYILFIKQLQTKIKTIPFGIYSYLFFEKDHNNDSKLLDFQVLDLLKGAVSINTTNGLFGLAVSYYNTPIILYGWSDWMWGIEERLNSRAYTIPSAEEMLSFGILAFLLENEQYKLVPSNSLIIQNSFEFLLQRIKGQLNTIRNKKEFWYIQFKKPNAAELEKSIEEVKVYLDQLKDQKEKASNKALSLKPLDPVKVNNFIANTNEQWKNNQNLNQVFEYFNSVVINPPDKLKQIGLNINAENLKFSFVQGNDNIPVFGLEFGKEVAKRKELLLGQAFIDSNISLHKETNLITGILNGIKTVHSDGYNPTIIFSTYDSMIREELELTNSGKYLPAWKQNQKLFPFTYLGIFQDNIPIVKLRSDTFKNVIIVTDLKNAMALFQRETDGWFEKRLNVKMELIDHKKATEIFSRKYSNSEISDDSKGEILETIMTGVIIDIDEICDFKLKDKDALYAFRVNM